MTAIFIRATITLRQIAATAASIALWQGQFRSFSNEKYLLSHQLSSPAGPRANAQLNRPVGFILGWIRLICFTGLPQHW
jgi:hypothetical protein